eukprot:TRINITY_DN9809_c0_g1_i2.p1 TRINITY_DN9809_c0_g1~~TRINITY_DN9809_c0_g1_i2.p1  ORF type:complete len:646 (+),score=101.20 TRINITY_DN9809_c0_g1_i2:304-2241(+)
MQHQNMLRSVRRNVRHVSDGVEMKRMSTRMNELFYHYSPNKTGYLFDMKEKLLTLLHGQEPLYKVAAWNKQHFRVAAGIKKQLPIDILHSKDLSSFSTYHLFQAIGKLSFNVSKLNPSSLSVVCSAFERFREEIELFSSTGISLLCLIAGKLCISSNSSDARPDVLRQVLGTLRGFVGAAVQMMLKDETFTAELNVSGCADMLLAMYICSVSHIKARHAIYSRLMSSQALQSITMIDAVCLLEYHHLTHDLPPSLLSRFLSCHSLWGFSSYLIYSVRLLWLCAVTQADTPTAIITEAKKAIKYHLSQTALTQIDSNTILKREKNANDYRKLAAIICYYHINDQKLINMYLSSISRMPELMASAIAMLGDYLVPSEDLENYIRGIKLISLPFEGRVMFFINITRLGYTAHASTLLADLSDMKGGEDLGAVCKLLRCAAVLQKACDDDFSNELSQLEQYVSERADELTPLQLQDIAAAMSHVGLHDVLRDVILGKCKEAFSPEQAPGLLAILALLPRDDIILQYCSNVFDGVVKNLNIIKAIDELLVCWQHAVDVGVVVSRRATDVLLRHCRPAMYGMSTSQLVDVVVYTAKSELPLDDNAIKTTTKMVDLIHKQVHTLSIKQKSRLSWALSTLECGTDVLTALSAV